jgi:hypothetical protein
MLWVGGRGACWRSGRKRTKKFKANRLLYGENDNDNASTGANAAAAVAIDDGDANAIHYSKGHTHDYFPDSGFTSVL